MLFGLSSCLLLRPALKNSVWTAMLNGQVFQIKAADSKAFIPAAGRIIAIQAGDIAILFSSLPQGQGRAVVR